MTPYTPHTTLASSLDQYIRDLDKSPLTIQAYRTDIQQFLTWLSENDVTVTRAHHVTRSHINEYLDIWQTKGALAPHAPESWFPCTCFFHTW